MNDKPVVHVIDDDENLRTALDLLLRSAGHATRLYASLDDFDPLLVSRSIGCVVLDVRMPGANGLEYHEQLSQRGIHLSVLMLTGHGDIPMTVRAMRAGAVDFLPKPFGEDEMLEAIAVAITRDRLRLSEQAISTELEDRFSALSRRERQVMALATAGRLNKQSAFELGLSEITIKAHRRSAMRKMKAASLAELVRMAEALQLTPQSPSAGIPIMGKNVPT